MSKWICCNWNSKRNSSKHIDIYIDKCHICRNVEWCSLPIYIAVFCSATRTAINELTRMDKKQPTDLNYMTMLKMDPMTECLTVNNMSTNKHVNLVQVKKIKAENQASTISLDIISGKCQDGKHSDAFCWHKYTSASSSSLFLSISFVCMATVSRTVPKEHHHRKGRISGHSNDAIRNILLAFSWRQNFRLLTSEFTEHCIMDVIEISGLRVLCVLWILLVHVTTALYFVAGMLPFVRPVQN